MLQPISPEQRHMLADDAPARYAATDDRAWTMLVLMVLIANVLAVIYLVPQLPL
jgi:hypothetical protein